MVLQLLGKETSGVGIFVLRHFLRRACSDDPPSLVPPFRPEVDEVVGGFYDVNVVLDDNDAVAHIDETVDHIEQPLYVHKVESRRRLVEEVDGIARSLFPELLGKPQPLRLAAREGGRRLPEPQIPHADIIEDFETLLEGRDRREKLQCLRDRHLEDIGDILAFVINFERLFVVPFAFAGIAGYIDIGKEMHLDLFHAVALTGFAASTRQIEAEARCLVSAHPRIGEPGKEIPDKGEGARIGGRVRAGSPAQG